MSSPDPPRGKVRTTDIRAKVSFARRFSFTRAREFFLGKNFLDLKPRLKDRFLWLWVFVLLVAAIVFFGVRGPFTQAETKDFFPTACLGDWENPGLAIGEPESMAASGTAPTASTSASYDGSENQIYCNGFVPADFSSSGSVVGVGLTLVWNVIGSAPASTPSSSAATEPTSTPTLAPTSTPTPMPTSSPAPAEATDLTPTPSPVPASTSDPSPTLAPAPSPTPDAENTPDPEDDTATTTSLAPSHLFFADLIARAFADGSDDTPSDTAAADTMVAADDTGTAMMDVSGTVEDAADTTTNMTDVDYATGTPDAAAISATGTDSIGDSSSSADVTAPAATATATDDATDTTDMIGLDAGATTTPDADFLAINYSIDGVNWIPLGTINMSNWPTFTVSVPVTNWSDLKHLEIQIEGIPTVQDPIPTVYLDGMFLEVQYEDPSGVPSDSSIYQHFFMDGTQYNLGDQIAITGAPPESYIEIYQFSDPDNPDSASNDYAVQVDNTGATTIDTNTLVSGRYILVNTLEPGACNEYSISECRARSDYVSETEIIVNDSPGADAALAE